MNAKDRMNKIRQVAHDARRTYMLGRHYTIILGHAQREVIGWHMRGPNATRTTPYAEHHRHHIRMASYGVCSVASGGKHARHDGDGICPHCGEEVGDE